MKRHFIFFIFLSCILLGSCQNQAEEDEKAGVFSIKFEKESISFENGQNAACILNINPKNADYDENDLNYSIIPEDICEIVRKDKSGCIIKGIKKGSGVLTASYGEKKTYLSVEVTDNSVTQFPYIKLAETDIQIEKGKRRSVVANLVGCSAGDINRFEWTSSDPAIVDVEYSGSTAVLTAKRYGACTITVRNEGCLYPASMIAAVPEKDGSIFYLTTENNVIDIFKNEKKSINIQIIGGTENDYSALRYKIIDVEESFSISASGGICDIVPLKSGSGQIEVVHPDSKIPLKITVNINEDSLKDRIICDYDFLYFDQAKSKSINCSLLSGQKGGYSYELSDNNIVDVININGKFIITPKKNGKVKMYVYNNLVQEKKEISIVVDNIFVSKDFCSICTGQNVIKLTEGQKDVEIEMELLGGNENDRSGFLWKVSDSKIISVETDAGKVTYTRSASSEKVFKAKAYVNALREGHAVIEVSHPKSSNSCFIDVFVYRKGVLSDSYIDVRGELLVKAAIGNEGVYSLEGNEIDYELINIQNSDSSIMDVYIENKMIKYKALKKGNVSVTLSSSQFRDKWTFNAVCDYEETLENKKYISADKSYIKGYKNSLVYFSISGNFNSEGYVIDALSSNTNICKTEIISNIICVELLNEGEALIRIECSGFENTIYIPVYCMKREDSVSYPYELEGEAYINLIYSKEYIYNFNLKEADEKQYLNCSYDYDDSQIKIEGSERGIKIKPLKEGKGKIVITHPSCSEKLNVNYFIYNNEQESLKQNVLWIENDVMQGRKGERLLLRINETIKNDEPLLISSNEIDRVRIQNEGNFIILDLLEKGKCQLKIEKGNSRPLYVEINILDDEEVQTANILNLPYLIQGIVNKEFSVNYESNFIDDNIIEWSVPDDFKYSRIKYGLNLICNKAGSYEIGMKTSDERINRTVRVIIYNNKEELESDINIYLDSQYYSISLNESLNLEVKTTGNFSEMASAGLVWKETDGKDGLDISYNGRNCLINGLKEGIYSVKVYSDEYAKEFSFTVQVNKENTGNSTNFNFERILYVKCGVTKSFKFFIDKENLSENDYRGCYVSYDDKEIDVSCSNDTIAVNARKEGDYLCTLSRYGINDYLFLVRCRENEETENDFLFSDRKTVELNINEEKTIGIFCSEGNTDNVNIWVSDDFIDIEKNDEGISVKGKKEGNGLIKITYNNEEITVYFSVSSRSYENNVTISVPDIIFVEKGKTVNNFVVCRKTVFYEYNERNISLNDSGNSFSVTGKEKGLSEIKVFTSEDNYKIIKVYVHEENNSVNDVRLINLSKRLYKCTKGQHIIISPYISGNDKDAVLSEYDEDFISMTEENGKYDIEIRNTGYTKINFRYHEDNVTIFIYCYDDVLSKEDEVSGNDNIEYYLTADELYSFIKINEAYTFKAQIKDFNGNYLYNNNYMWKTDRPDILELDYTYNACTVRAKERGRAVLYCTNLSCQNVLIFTVDTGYENDLYEKIYSFIHTDKTVYEINVNETVSFEAEFKNLGKEDQKKLKVIYDENNLCRIDYTVNDDRIYFSVRGLKCGSEKVKLSCEGCDFDTDVTLIVNAKTGGRTPYLTTSQNYSVIKPGETSLLSVRMENYDENDMKNYKWEKTGGEDCVTLIGNGSDIQIYGKKEGLTEIKVLHVPTQSELILYVLVSSQVKTVKYMTAKTLVIDTKVSSVLDNITFSIIGGEEKDKASFEYTADRTDILSIVSSGDNLYYRGLKEGVAKVHVSNTKSGCVNELDVIFIVSDNKNNAFMKADFNTLYMKKNTGTKSVNVTFENCNEINEGVIEWFIYSQQSKSGDVVSIVSSGKRCVIKPLNAGYATVRAYYSPLNLSASVSVYVDEIGKVMFETDRMVLSRNESGFIGLKIPDYIEGITQYISFQSMDESVCRAFGTGRVCCIEAVEKGSCIIRAVNSFDDSVSEIGVTVIDEEKNDCILSLRKNTYLLNPRTEEQKMSAFITGKNIEGFEEEDIRWEIISDTSGCLSLYPDRGSDVLLNLNPVNDVNDSYYGKVKTGQAVIKVSHNLCEAYRTIYVSIDEMDNFFKLEKYSAKINVSQSYTLNCSIVNSKSSDYDKVKWSISGFNTDKYGNRVEVARLLNDGGRSASIFGLNEGTCTVTAFYLGNSASCEVTVNADRTFRINGTTSIKMFPDVMEDNFIDVSYIVRPSSQVPVWSVQNVDRPADISMLSVEEVPGSQKIRLRPNGVEGKCKVTGFVVGVGQVTLNVDIKFIPELRFMEEVTDCIIEMEEGKENIRKYRFASYPAMYYVNVTKSGKYADYADVFIEETKKKDEYLEGTVVVKAKKEFPVNGISVLLQQYRSSAFDPSSKVDSNDSRLTFTVSAYYPDNGFYLGFRRGRGGFSFYNESSNAALLYDVNEKFIKDKTQNTYYKFYDSDDDKPHMFELGDGEQHYFILKTKHENSFMDKVSVSIESDNMELKINDILNNKMKDFSAEERLDVINNIEAFSTRSMPKISTLEQKSDGAYIFDISTGESDYKYGINWYIKGREDPKKNKYLTAADPFYCNSVKYKKPLFYFDEYLGSIDDVYIKEEKEVKNFYFKNRPDLKFILDYEWPEIEDSEQFWTNIAEAYQNEGVCYYPLNYNYYLGYKKTLPEIKFKYYIGSSAIEVLTKHCFTKEHFVGKKVLEVGDYWYHKELSKDGYGGYYYMGGLDDGYPSSIDVYTIVNEYGKYALFEYHIEGNYPDKYLLMKINKDFTRTDSKFVWGEEDGKGINYVGAAVTWFEGPLGYRCLKKGTDNNDFTDHAVFKNKEDLIDYSLKDIHNDFNFSYDKLECNYYEKEIKRELHLASFSVNKQTINIKEGTLEIKKAPETRTEISEINKNVSKVGYEWKEHIENYISDCYYNNDRIPDFEFDKLYLVISYNNIFNKTVTVKIPFRELFYNNYSDYYTFENGKVVEHPGRINSRIDTINYD